MRESLDILTAWIVLAFGLTNMFLVDKLILMKDLSLIDFSAFLMAMGMMLLIIGPAFIGHELAHRFVAKRFGGLARFGLWPAGLILTVITSFLGFIIAAPGAVYFAPGSRKQQFSIKEIGLTALAGPLVNIGLIALFLPLASASGGVEIGSIDLVSFSYISYRINAILAFFNLLPFGPLDGKKIVRYNKWIWVGLFGFAATIWFYPLLIPF